MAKKLGRQEPTLKIALPYTKSKGTRAVKRYNATGRKAQRWQSLMCKDILAINNDNLWVHTKVGYSVPRRNGKNEILCIVELDGLLEGIKTLHTAHRTTTSHAAAVRLAKFLDDLGYEEVQRISKKATYSKHYTFSKQFGLERLVLLDTGGSIDFRTRSGKGGLGEGFDRLIIDEAQEYTDDQESALKYVVSDSKNPQIIMCGTPPTAVSSGTVFVKFRDDTIAQMTEDSMWAEWSVEEVTDVRDVEAWYLTNPSLGTILTERKIRAEITNDDIDFNIQRLGYWFKYNQKSAISQSEWEALEVIDTPTFKGKLFVGIKYGNDGKNVSLSLAVKTENNKIFVESIDCRPQRIGNDWIIAFLKKVPNIENVVVDGAAKQLILVKELKDAQVKHKTILPKVSEIITANSMFEDGVNLGNICHKIQPSLETVISNCAKRPIGSNGGFGYKGLKADIEISLMDSVILAHWSAKTTKTTKKQKINY